MGVVGNDNIETLAYLKRSIKRMRETAWTHPDTLRVEMLRIADQIAVDTAKLEHELAMAGYLPAAANVT